MLDRSFRSSARNAFIARSKQRAYECFEKKRLLVILKTRFITVSFIVMLAMLEPLVGMVQQSNLITFRTLALWNCYARQFARAREGEQRATDFFPIPTVTIIIKQ